MTAQRPAYPQTLTDLWQKATAPRSDDAPTLVSTFAGCGGSSLGYHAAGFRELLAVEWEPHAAAHLRMNFPEVKVHEGDIAQVGKDSLDLAPGELDVLDGSPPCQGFSMAGKRQVADIRNTLFTEFLRLADVWKPKVLVMENVPGMARGRTRPIFLACMQGFAKTGYRAEARILRGDRLGGASIRQRLYIIGVREDLGVEPTFPSPTYGYSLREALENVDASPSPRMARQVASLIPYMAPGTSGDTLLSTNNRGSNYFGTWRADWAKPVRTLLKHNQRAGVVHPVENRYLSITEMKRVQGFPDEYVFEGTPEQIQDRIGNSVMPPMAMRVGLAVRDKILDRLR